MRFGAVKPANTTWNLLVEGEANKEKVANIFISNDDSSDQDYALALASSTSPSTPEWITPQVTLGTKEFHQITGVPIGDGEYLMCKVFSSSTINFVAAGLEKEV
jgi:hypothetical protein